jgi:uncharacterized protein with NAD-binding domain and iron-sulfur cluster
VLGGGPAALAAAFELTAPELEGRFEVTIYQRGWRLGGKCASGRNLAQGARIEEHGLHVWFGFYDNAFRMMRTALAELDRPPGHALATLEDAFQPCDRLVLSDRQGDRWQDFPIELPRNALAPGEEGPLPELWEVAARVCSWAMRRWRPSLGGRGSRAGRALLYITRRLAVGGMRGGALLSLQGETPDMAGVRRRTPLRARLLALMLTRLRDWMWEHRVKLRCAHDPHLRLFFTTFDTFASAIAGIVRDGVLERGWAAIDDRDLCEWLAAHGAKQLTVGATPVQRAPVLRAVYDLAFAYPRGDLAAANAAAGTATRNLLRLLFAYRGAVLYKMRAGMGDTVIAPLYELLQRRGVRFRFFTCASRIHLSRDGLDVSSIEVIPQAELARERYAPLVDVKGLACWPSQPLWEQLRDGERLAQAGVDFERECNPLGSAPVTLERGRDFDAVVLGVPVDALGTLADEVVRLHPRFARMLASAETVATQSFQLWLTRPTRALGWPHGENSVAGARVEPLDTWCDMSYLLAREGWRDGEGVRGLAYFCGVLDDRAGESHMASERRVHDGARAFLEAHAGELWPRARAAGDGATIDWRVLADATGCRGAERLRAQYWRANTAPGERYVLTPAGSLRERLAADESGVRNLLLAGDWTRNGIDGGCVEAAVCSGMQAARALIARERAPAPAQLHAAISGAAREPMLETGRT